MRLIVAHTVSLPSDQQAQWGCRSYIGESAEPFNVRAKKVAQEFHSWDYAVQGAPQRVRLSIFDNRISREKNEAAESECIFQNTFNSAAISQGDCSNPKPLSAGATRKSGQKSGYDVNLT